MKRIIVGIMVLAALLCGCEDKSSAEYYVTEEVTAPSNKQQVLSFEEADVVKIEQVEDNSEGLKRWKVTNNGDRSLTSVTLTVGYVGEDGTVLDTHYYSTDTGLNKGDSEIVTETLKVSEGEAKVYGYDYELVEEDEDGYYYVIVDYNTKEVQIR